MAKSHKKIEIGPLGAHTSAAGGAYNALLEGDEIGATTVQLFTSNQKQWKGKVLDGKDISLWKDAREKTGLTEIMSHDSYLINLGAPDASNLEKSRKAFREELNRCLQLEIEYLNFHPGAALKDDPQACMDRICESLIELEEMFGGPHKTRLLLEATAGQGSAIGHRFEHLDYIIQKVKSHVPIGVCIDTCHIFAAGYDIRTPEAWDATLREFDRVVGIKHLYAFHLNDSMRELGSRVDRHDEIGKGKIGLESFRFLMNDSRTRSLPKYLETPGGPELWKKEIALLKELAGTSSINQS